MPTRKGTETGTGDLCAIDLFSGAGGLTLGLRQAGFRVVGAIEIDALAVETYRSNHPGVRVWNADIAKVDPQEMRRSLGLEPGELDLLAGCPPCQGFSSIRTRRRASAVDDDRNDLVLQLLRFARELLPAAVMMENVPGLLTDARLRRLRAGLNRLGYRTRARVFDASVFGVPQRRHRLILLARRTLPPRFATPTSDRMTVRQAIGGLGHPGSSGDPLHDLQENRSKRIEGLIDAVPRNGGSLRDASDRFQLACHVRTRGFYDVYGRMSWDEVAPTITGGCINPSKGRFLHPEQNRAVTLREAALLQGFPADYTFSLARGKYAAAAMIGNALPPEFIRRHALSVREQLVAGT